MIAAHTVGTICEDAACAWLQSQGLKLLARNHRARSGEIDLVMSDGETLVFVEVRYRRSARCGGAAASVDARKRQRIVSAARHYLSLHPDDRPCRFDVLACTGLGRWQWIKRAFEASADD